MQTLPTIYYCKTKEELCKQVLDAHSAIQDFYKNIPDEFFGTNAIPEGWSVKRNMKHVISTNTNLGFFIGLPKFILKLFGKPNAKQLDVDAIDPTNRHGISNYGRYEKTTLVDLKEKEELLKLIQASAEKLNSKIAKRTDAELDSMSGPFGGMSLRTFVLFLIKHNVHHTNVVRRRIEESI